MRLLGNRYRLAEKLRGHANVLKAHREQWHGENPPQEGPHYEFEWALRDAAVIIDEDRAWAQVAVGCLQQILKMVDAESAVGREARVALAALQDTRP